MSNDAKTLTDEELIQHLANAMHTGAMCGGHGKAHYNRVAANAFKTEAESRGLTLPDASALYKMGTFNGPGSY